MVTFTVRVTNNTGHKLPTGFAEGRQTWLHVKGVDSRGRTVFEDGIVDPAGILKRTPQTKVYEQVVIADGYEPFVLDGVNILDANRDGSVSLVEKEFHFVLMNKIEKDNRIPPRGFVRDARAAAAIGVCRCVLARARAATPPATGVRGGCGRQSSSTLRALRSEAARRTSRGRAFG